MLTSHPHCVQSKAMEKMKMGHESPQMLNSFTGARVSQSKKMNANRMPVFTYSIPGPSYLP